MPIYKTQILQNTKGHREHRWRLPFGLKQRSQENGMRTNPAWTQSDLYTRSIPEEHHRVHFTNNLLRKQK